MTIGRLYTIDSGLMTHTGTSQIALLAGTTGAAVTFSVAAIGFGISSGAGVSYPSNGTVHLQLLRSTGTAAAGTAATKNPKNALAQALACQSTWLAGSTATPVTGLTATAVEVWGMTVPFSAGANWREWDTPGEETDCGPSANLVLWVTPSAAGTATQFKAQLVIGE